MHDLVDTTCDAMWTYVLLRPADFLPRELHADGAIGVGAVNAGGDVAVAVEDVERDPPATDAKRVAVHGLGRRAMPIDEDCGLVIRVCAGPKCEHVVHVLWPDGVGKIAGLRRLVRVQ